MRVRARYVVIKAVFGISRCGEVEHQMRGPQRVRFWGINGTRKVQHCSRVGFKKESTSQVLQKRFVKATSLSISDHKYDLLGASPRHADLRSPLESVERCSKMVHAFDIEASV